MRSTDAIWSTAGEAMIQRRHGPSSGGPRPSWTSRSDLESSELGRLVEDSDRRVLENGAGDGRCVASVHRTASDPVVRRSEAWYRCVNPAMKSMRGWQWSLRRPPRPPRRRGPAYAMSPGCSGEQGRILEHDPDASPQVFERECPDVRSRDPDRTAGRCVQTQEQTDEASSCRPRSPDERPRASCVADREADLTKDVVATGTRKRRRRTRSPPVLGRPCGACAAAVRAVHRTRSARSIHREVSRGSRRSPAGRSSTEESSSRTPVPGPCPRAGMSRTMDPIVNAPRDGSGRR